MVLGIDWTQVDWTDVAKLISISAALTVIVLAAIKFLPVIPVARKKLFYFFAVLVIWTPVGLITPGVAYGEWLPEQGFDKLPGAGYLPHGIDQLSRLWKAPLQFYQFPWVSQTAPVSQQTPGYIVSAALGVVIVVGATSLLGRWLARREQSDDKAGN
jgi:cobalt/nickel transport protein